MSEAFSYDGELEEVTEFQAEDGKKKGKSALSTQSALVRRLASH